MKKQSFFGILPKVVGLLLMVMFLSCCKKHEFLYNDSGCYKVILLKPGKSDLIKSFHKKKNVKVPYKCNELIFDPSVDNADGWRKRFKKNGFEIVDSCDCQKKLELWAYKGKGIIDLEGVVKDPPPGNDGVGGISFNFIIDLNPGSDKIDPFEKENIPKLPAPNCKAKNVKIAIVDSGVDTSSQSKLLLSNWNKVNPSIRPNCSSFPSVLEFGFNLVRLKLEPSDYNGHGTHVNGIAAGITPHEGTDFMFPMEFINIKFTEKNTKQGDLFKAVCGLYHALEQKARVINISWGYRDTMNKNEPLIMKKFLDEAQANDVVVVAAMGNDSVEITDTDRFWPASFASKYDNMISVGAIDDSDSKAIFSNWSNKPNVMTITARGVGIPSAYIYGRYAKQSGTSMATPYVTRTAAAIRSINPLILAGDVKKLIIDSARKDPRGYLILDHLKTLKAICN